MTADEKIISHHHHQGETSTTAPSKANTLEVQAAATHLSNKNNNVSSNTANSFMHRGRRLFPQTGEQQQLQHQTNYSAEVAQEPNTAERSNELLQD